jgi:hypothetical protein
LDKRKVCKQQDKSGGGNEAEIGANDGEAAGPNPLPLGLLRSNARARPFTYLGHSFSYTRK